MKLVMLLWMTVRLMFFSPFSLILFIFYAYLCLMLLLFLIYGLLSYFFFSFSFFPPFLCFIAKIHDGLYAPELTFLFLTGHWPSDLLSRFQQHYLSIDFSSFVRSLFKLIRSRLWNELWAVWHLAVLPP